MAREPDKNSNDDARLLDLVRAMQGMTLEHIKRIVIDGAIDGVGGGDPAAAHMLGVSPATLYRKSERWASTQSGK